MLQYSLFTLKIKATYFKDFTFPQRSHKPALRATLFTWVLDSPLPGAQNPPSTWSSDPPPPGTQTPFRNSKKMYLSCCKTGELMSNYWKTNCSTGYSLTAWFFPEGNNGKNTLHLTSKLPLKSTFTHSTAFLLWGKISSGQKKCKYSAVKWPCSLTDLRGWGGLLGSCCGIRKPLKTPLLLSVKSSHK